MKFSLIIFVVLSILALGQNSNLEPCPDPPYNNALAKIIVDAIETFRPFMKSGAPDLGIPPLDPLGPIPSVAFGIHNDYLDLDGTVNETIIYNLSEFVTCEVTIDIGLRPRFFMEFRLNDYHMNGVYDMNGVYVSIFPIYGTGNYVLDVINASMSGGARVSYNVITDHVQIHDLELGITFDKLELFMECILGCGDMADFVNNFLSEIATAIFNALWDYIDPILTKAIEGGINRILKNIKISNIVKPDVRFPSGNVQLVRNDQKINFRFPLNRIIQKQIRN